MQRCLKLALVAIVSALVASPALAQQRGMGMGQMSSSMLLGQESVQKELKLTDEQIKKAESVREKTMAMMQEIRQNAQGDREQMAKKMLELNQQTDKSVAEFLKPEQVKRLKQITLQQTGVRAVANPEVAAALKVTDEQKQKIQDLQMANATKMRELFQGAGGDFAEMRKKMEEFNKTANEQFMGLLTEEQKTKWKELIGEPFTGKIEFRRPNN